MTEGYREEIKEKLEKEGGFLIQFVDSGNKLMSSDSYTYISTLMSDNRELLLNDLSVLEYPQFKGGGYDYRFLWDRGKDAVYIQ